MKGKGIEDKEGSSSGPEHYRKFNPENGWGNYEGLVQFVKEYLIACARFSEARVLVSR